MARRSLAANCRGPAIFVPGGIFVLGAAAFDGVAFGAPAQHSAGKVGDLGEAGFALADALADAVGLAGEHAALEKLG